MQDLRSELLTQRLATYTRLKGGYPIPLAGSLYWLALGISGFHLRPGLWNLIAFIGSGMIFPLALLFAKMAKVDFLKDESVVGDVLPPTFIGMMLFWPIAVTAMWNAPQMVPLVLAIGLSQHWPVIGWSYGRTGLFSAHSIVRAIGAFVIWNWLPSGRFTVLPFWVAAVYLATVIAIYADVSRLARRGT